MTLAYFNYPEIQMIEWADNDDSDNKIQILLKNKRTYKFKENVDFLFTYADIKDKLHTVIANWYSLFEKIKPVLGGLIQSFDKHNKVSEFNFLSIVQSLETLHRRIRKNMVIDKASFKAKVSEIISSIPQEHKEWVKERLQYANEPTLLNRLKEFLGELPISLKQKLFNDEEEFAASVKDTRNYYTHYSEHLSGKALKGIEIFYVTERLKVLLVAFLLKELGILDDKFEKDFLKRGHRIFYYTFQDFKSFTS